MRQHQRRQNPTGARERQSERERNKWDGRNQEACTRISAKRQTENDCRQPQLPSDGRAQGQQRKRSQQEEWPKHAALRIALYCELQRELPVTRQALKALGFAQVIFERDVRILIREKTIEERRDWIVRQHPILYEPGGDENKGQQRSDKHVPQYRLARPPEFPGYKTEGIWNREKRSVFRGEAEA